MKCPLLTGIILRPTQHWFTIHVKLKKSGSELVSAAPGLGKLNFVNVSKELYKREERKLTMQNVLPYNSVWINSLQKSTKSETCSATILDFSPVGKKVFDNFVCLFSLPWREIWLNPSSSSRLMINGIWGGATLHVYLRIFQKTDEIGKKFWRHKGIFHIFPRDG